jgi:hypothetical protein
MAEQHEGVSPATAGGASAPNLSAIRDMVLDSLRAVPPLWQFRQGLVAAGLIPADAEIQAVERKPVNGEPGIRMEWDEDVEAMRIDGIGWDLSFGCTVSFAYDHDRGEHYVCVSTSDADQRAGITSRRTTKEQLASLGQQLVNVFGRPDPRDAEIERLRLARRALAATGHFRDDEVGDDVAPRIAELNSARTAEIERLRGDALLFQQHLQRAHGRPDNEVTDEYMGVDFSRAMVDGLRDGKERAERDLERLREHSAARFRDLCAALETDPSIERWDSVLSGVGAAIAERDRLRTELDGQRADKEQAEAAYNRLRQELDDVRSQAGRIEVDRSGKAVLLGRIRDILGEADAKPAEPRRWHAGDPEPEIGTRVYSGSANIATLRSDGTWHWESCQDDCRAAGPSWQELVINSGGEVVEVVGTDG